MEIRSLLEKLFDNEQTEMVRIATAKVGEGAAWDIVQRACVEAWEDCEQAKWDGTEDGLRKWLYRIFFNAVKDYRRKRERECRCVSPISYNTLSQANGDKEEQAIIDGFAAGWWYERTGYELDQWKWKEALSTLKCTDKQKEIIVFCYFCDETYCCKNGTLNLEKVAMGLGMSRGNLQNHLCCVKNKLLKVLDSGGSHPYRLFLEASRPHTPYKPAKLGSRIQMEKHEAWREWRADTGKAFRKSKPGAEAIRTLLSLLNANPPKEIHKNSECVTPAYQQWQRRQWYVRPHEERDLAQWLHISMALRLTAIKLPRPIHLYDETGKLVRVLRCLDAISYREAYRAA